MSSEIRPEGENRYRQVDAPNNSNKSKDEPKEDSNKKQIKQIATATTRKKGLGTRIKESFVGDDARSVGEYVFFDVFLPAIQNLVVEGFQKGVERLILGDSRPNNTRRASERRGGSNYTNHYRRAPEPRSPRDRYDERARSQHDFDQIVLPDRGQAEEVLDVMGDLLEKYDQVTLSDMYRLVGIRGSFMDDRWGWTSLRGATVRRVSDGYVLELPSPIDLDRR